MPCLIIIWLNSLKVIFLLLIDKLCRWRGWNFVTHLLNIPNGDNRLLPVIFLCFWIVVLEVVHVGASTKRQSMLCHSWKVTFFVYDLEHVVRCGLLLVIVLIFRGYLGDLRKSPLHIHILCLRLLVRLYLRVDSMCVDFGAIALSSIVLALRALVDVVAESLCLLAIGDDHHLLGVLLRCHSEGISSSHNKLRL